MPLRPRPLLTATAAVAAGGALLLPLSPAVAGLGAGPDRALPQDGDLRLRVAEARGEAGTSPVRRAAALGCFATPEGDVIDLITGEPATYPQADLVEYCVDNAATIRVTARTVDPTPPPSAPEDAGYFAVQWALDVSGDDVPEYVVSDEQGVAVVLDVRDHDFEGEPVCEADASFDGSRHAVSFSSRCIAQPDAVRVAASVMAAPDTQSVEGPAYVDATDFSTPVRRTGALVGTRRETGRLAGADRYATAVAVSQAEFGEGASTVYLARGDVYAPDALAGGSLTDGPVLLVPQCGPLPAVVAEEVRRLAPRRVLALGGEAAVCGSMVTAAANA